MKIFNYVFALLFSTLLFTACAPDEVLEPNEIIGTWLLKSVDLEGNATFTQGAEVTQADFTGEGFDLDLSITIHENPNDYIVEGDVNVLLKYDFDGQTVELPIEEADFIDSGVWDISNDELTVTNSDKVEVATLGDLTETALTLEWTYTDSVATTGSVIVHEVTGTYVFERQ